MRSSGCVPGWGMSFSPPPRGGGAGGEGETHIARIRLHHLEAKSESPLTYDAVKTKYQPCAKRLRRSMTAALARET
jgi:hypothetical protein